MKLLLISPKFNESFWSVRWIVTQLTPDRPETLPPLGLATAAALCPPHWEVEIVNENLDPVPFDTDADIVGVCGMGVQFERQKELLKYYRSRGHYVVAGGSYASLCPELYGPFADTVIAGEAEYIWPQFCRDFDAGRPQRLYQETGEVSLQDSPLPRFDLAEVGRYHMGSLQFTRGCPYRCEFCDIIVMFGRKPRFKTPQQIERELDLLYECGAHDILFADDNFIGNKKIAKEMLKFLVSFQEKRRYRIAFGTNVSLNLAQDPELMQLFRRANFNWFLIGVESPNEASLAETKKTQNLREKPLEALNRIQSMGFNIWSSMVIGFDHDSEKIFDQQFEFIQNAGLQRLPISLLTAFPKTPLHERMQNEGRLREVYDNDMLSFRTNITPKQMDYATMLDGYRALHRRLFTDRNIGTRVKTRSALLKVPSAPSSYSKVEQTKVLGRLLYKGILRGGPPRWYHFLRSLPYAHPKLIPDALLDWSVAIQVQDFTRRNHLRPEDFAPDVIRDVHAELDRTFAPEVRSGVLAIRSEAEAGTGSFEFLIRGSLGASTARFQARMRRSLRRILHRTIAPVTFVFEKSTRADVEGFNRLLKTFPLHCDRFYVDLDDSLKKEVRVDAVKVNVVLREQQPVRPRSAGAPLEDLSESRVMASARG